MEVWGGEATSSHDIHVMITAVYTLSNEQALGTH